MDAEIKEKLIDIVRKHPCIYESSDKNYKNVNFKSLLWQNIGSQLSIEGETAKKLWRSLRDGYMRYKRLMKQQTGSERKIIQYVWSEQMAFIDESLELRPTSSNVTEICKTETSNESSELHQSTSPSLPSPPGPPPLLTTHSQPMTPLSPQPLPPPSSPISKRKHMPTEVQEREDKSLEHLNSKKSRRTIDGTDHLFMSYSDTFKKLPLIQQAQLKVELAKLFANAEINAYQNNQEEEGSIPVVVLSPEYSVLSEQTDLHNIDN